METNITTSKRSNHTSHLGTLFNIHNPLPTLDSTVASNSPSSDVSNFSDIETFFQNTFFKEYDSDFTIECPSTCFDPVKANIFATITDQLNDRALKSPDKERPQSTLQNKPRNQIPTKHATKTSHQSPVRLHHFLHMRATMANANIVGKYIHVKCPTELVNCIDAYLPESLLFPNVCHHSPQLIHAIQVALNQPLIELSPPRFKFESSPKSANHSYQVLQDNSFDLQKTLSLLPPSICTPGSEFRLIPLLEPILGKHPLWQFANVYLSTGVPAILTVPSPQKWHQAKNEALIAH
jgi:hypothetical protein